MTVKENRAFCEMLAAAKSRLADQSPSEIAEKAHVFFDAGHRVFHLSSLGEEITVHYPSYDIEQELDEWHHLVILHYLDMADGTPMEQRMIPFGELRDGLVRGGGFDRTCEQTMARYFTKKPLENLQMVCTALGASIESSNADLCAVLPFLPQYPVTWKLWLAEEEDEIDASGRLFLNSSADHYLSVEDAVTVGTLILDKLRQQYEAMFPGIKLLHIIFDSV
ncbi:MAG: DUF3786 domain-containing protein [Oscillospiraceae bacterium]|nr:DUF3786 domain-containing protein [Oscillospiraceae bacterium]